VCATRVLEQRLEARASGTAVRRSLAFAQVPHASALPTNAEVFDK
jgi:hypothetical protein